MHKSVSNLIIFSNKKLANFQRQSISGGSKYKQMCCPHICLKADTTKTPGSYEPTSFSNPKYVVAEEQGKKLHALPKAYLTFQVAMQNKGLDGPLVWASRALLMFQWKTWFICSESQLDTEQIIIKLELSVNEVFKISSS